jgi:hypothetical protein
VTVVIGPFEEGHEGERTETFLLDPSARLTIRSIGGAGGVGGKGGNAARDSAGKPLGSGRDAGNGASGGPGGKIVIRCPAALRDEAQKCVVAEALAGAASPGGAGGDPGGRAGSPGASAGAPGSVEWVFS